VKRRPLRSVVGRYWMLLVTTVVVALAAFAVIRLQGAFGSEDNAATPVGAADQIVPFNPKRVLLEVFGAPGATATITYLDVDAHPQRVDGTPLPWSYEDSTTTPAVLTNIQAQTDGYTLGCRITIDGVVKVERSSDGAASYVYCLDKSG
jgi:hypothetical protein